MLHRPPSITFIGAILISLGILNGWGIASTVRITTEMSAWSQMFSRDGELFALLTVATAIELIAGINILRGKNWARVLWTSWYVIDLGLKFFLSIQTPIPFQIVLLAFIYFLFRPDADAFFETD